MSNARSKAIPKNGHDIRKVLVGSDLTSYSDRALDRAFMLARHLQASLQIVHAFDPTLLPARELAREKRRLKTRLEREWQESPVRGDITPTVTVVSGGIDAVMPQTATAMHADLVIVGLTDRLSLASVFSGATADRVMRRISCPILTVKRRPQRDYGSIVVALDTGPASQRALDMALRAFPEAQITVIHVSEGPSPHSKAQINDIIRARCEDAAARSRGAVAPPSLIIKSGPVGTALQREIERIDPDLVIAGSHGRSGISKLALGSVAESLLSDAPCDVLIART